MSKSVGIIAGSLRRDSFSKKIAYAIQSMAPAGFAFKIVSIDNLPVYNQDFDDYNQAPESYTAFRNNIKELDGVIFVTPEHNRSVPAALKNAIDIGSRPYGKMFGMVSQARYSAIRREVSPVLALIII